MKNTILREEKICMNKREQEKKKRQPISKEGIEEPEVKTEMWIRKQ